MGFVHIGWYGAMVSRQAHIVYESSRLETQQYPKGGGKDPKHPDQVEWEERLGLVVGHWEEGCKGNIDWPLTIKLNSQVWLSFFLLLCKAPGCCLQKPAMD